jgi:hypothetical protein
MVAIVGTALTSGQVLKRTVGAKYWMDDHLFYPGRTCILVM